MSASGTKRRFAPPQNSVAIGGITDIGGFLGKLARSQMTHSGQSGLVPNALMILSVGQPEDCLPTQTKLLRGQKRPVTVRRTINVNRDGGSRSFGSHLESPGRCPLRRLRALRYLQ